METLERRIKEGFPGQRSIVLPRPLVSAWLQSGPLVDFLPSDVGFYPTAANHFVDRTTGIPQSVIIYCVDGEGWATLAGRTMRIAPGTCLVTLPGQPHAYGADGNHPWTIYWAHAVGSKAASLHRLLDVEDAPPLVFPGLSPSLPAHFEKMLAILEKGYTTDTLLTASVALAQLLAQLITLRHRAPGDGRRTDNRVTNVIAFMEKHLGGPLNVPDLAREMNTSRSHLAAIFKQKTGFSILDFFTRMKMQRACTLLDTTDLPIKTVSLHLGYDDQLYFSRCFRRIHACSPLQYRSVRKG